MTVTFTVKIDDISGVDTRNLLTGNAKIDEYLGGNDNSAGVAYCGFNPNIEKGGYLRVEYLGRDFLGSNGGLGGQISSAVLYWSPFDDGPKDPLAHLSIDFGDSGQGYVGVPSVKGVTPDTLMNSMKYFGVAFNVVGNIGGDKIFGSSYDDTIDGRAGADVMVGHGGDDLYAIDNKGDRVIELDDEGYDAVVSTVSYTLAGGAIHRVPAP